MQTPQEFNFTDTQEQAFDVKAFLFGYLRYWYWFVISMAVCGLLAWLYLRYTVPEYEAYNKLLIKDGKSDQMLSEESVLQDLGLLGSSSNLVNEMELLKSRSMMLQVVNNLGIYTRYYAVGTFKETELFGAQPFLVDTTELDVDALAGQRFEIALLADSTFSITQGEKNLGEYTFGEWITVGKSKFKLLASDEYKAEKYNNPFAIQFTNALATARSYSNKLDISQVRDRASVLRLALVDYNGDKAVAILDELVKVYNQANINDKNRVGKNTLQFIEERIDFLTLELADVEGDVERYKSGNNIALELESRAEDVLSRVNSYEQEIAQVEVQVELANALLNAIRNPERPYDLLPASLNNDNGELNITINQYNQLILQREQLAKSAGGSNPLLLNLESQLDDLRQNISNNLATYLRSIQLSKAKIESKYADLRTTLRSIPKAERELLEKKRQQIIKENLFLYLLQKREETALSLAVTVPNSRVVDPAESTSGPITPVPFNIMALAVFLGLALPIGGILTKQILDDKVRGEKDIKDFSPVPIVGAIAETKLEHQVVVSPNSRSGVAEMFRLIRTNLRFMSPEGKTPTFLVTSTISGEGKTFVSVNLGMTMAIANKRTLLMGFDLRKPKMGTYLKEDDTSRGISSYIVDDTLQAADIIRHSSFHPKLDFITSGPIPPNPAELILTDRMRELMEYAQAHYDIVIIDTPPVGLVADAFLINNYVTNSLYVVRAGKTPKSVVATIDDIYQQGKLNNLACILNGISSKDGYGYNYGYGSGYGYGYGYYDEDKVRKSWWKFWK